MRIFIPIIILLLTTSSLFGQKEVRTYHDPIVQSKIKEIYLVNSSGQKHGSYKKFDSNGKLILKATFSKSFAHGKQEFWIGMQDENECAKLPYSIKNYSNGDPTGTWYEYGCKEGKRVLILMEKYENGDKVYYEKYTVDGVKIEASHPITGLNTAWYINGQKKIEFNMLEGVYHGPINEWYPDGAKLAEGQMEKGKWFGTKTIWYSNGQKKSIENYAKGDMYGEIFDGEQVYYDSLGSIEKKEVYEPIQQGRQVVKVTTFYSNGNPESEYSEVLSNRRAGGSSRQYTGVMTMYYENGNKSLEGNLNRRGNRDGVWISYNEDGSESVNLKYSDGYRAGKWTIYYDENWEEVNSISDASFYREITFTATGSITNTPVVDYYKSGQKQFEGQLTAVEPDVLNGPCVFYYENGNISSKGVMVNGQQSGKWEDFHENGNLKLTSSYAVNPSAGPTTNDPLGKNKVYEMNGVWFYYNEDGAKYKKEVYAYGKLVSTKDIKIK